MWRQPSSFHHANICVCNSVWKCRLPQRRNLCLLWFWLALLYKLDTLTHVQLLQAYLHAALWLWHLEKKRHLEETLILLPERSIPWPLNLGQLITSGHVTLEFASYVVPVFPLPFQYLISVQHCVSLSQSASFTSPLLPLHLSPFFTSSLALSSKELRHHYSVHRLTFHPLSY